MADRHQAPAYPLRLPEDLKARLVAAAKTTGRSFNSEVAARLAASFNPLETNEGKAKLLAAQLEAAALSLALDKAEASALLAEDLRDWVDEIAHDWGVGWNEALERLVLAGATPNAPQVLVLYTTPGATMADYKTAMAAAAEVAHPEASVHMRPARQQETAEQKKDRRLRPYRSPVKKAASLATARQTDLLGHDPTPIELAALQPADPPPEAPAAPAKSSRLRLGAANKARKG